MTESNTSHAFVPAGSSDSRSPCPALNALANHSYLAHDGRNLSVPQLIHALREVYHISLPMASLLSVVGAIMCGNGWKLDLEGLAQHNRIEHDGSLTHADAAPGAKYAPIEVDQGLLQHLLDLSSDGRTLTFEDLVRARVSRDASLAKPLDGFHNAISRGEVALTSEMFRNEQGEIPKEYIRQWFGEQKLPDGWTRPSQVIGLVLTTKTSMEVGKLATQLTKKE